MFSRRTFERIELPRVEHLALPTLDDIRIEGIPDSLEDRINLSFGEYVVSGDYEVSSQWIRLGVLPKRFDEIRSDNIRIMKEKWAALALPVTAEERLSLFEKGTYDSPDPVVIPLDREHMVLRKYRVSTTRFPPRWSGLELPISLYGKAFNDVLVYAGLYRVNSDIEIKIILTRISEYMNVHGPISHPEIYHLFPGLEKLGGWVSDRPVAQFLGSVKNWVVSSAGVRRWGKSYAHYLRDFARSCLEVYGIPEESDDWQSLNDWLLSLRLGTSGSSTSPVPLARVGKDIIRLRKTKNSMILGLSQDEALRRVIWPGPVRAMAFVKREQTKQRAVVAANNESFINQTYLLDRIVKATRSGLAQRTSLVMSSKEIYRMYSNISNATASELPVPADQSKFDHQVDLIEIWIIVYTGVLLTLAVDPEPQLLWRAFLGFSHSITHGRVRVGDISLPWNQGLISGIGLTALIGSVYSSAQLIMSRKMLSALGYKIPYSLAYSQGDDIIFMVKDQVAAAAYLFAMETIGWSINVKKNWIVSRNPSTRVAPFLQVYIDKIKASGLPSRALGGVLWGKPNTPPLPPGLQRLQAALSNWHQVSTRGVDWSSLKPHVLADLSVVGQVSEEVILEWLTTPLYLGGGGFGSTGSIGATQSSASVRKFRLVDYGLLEDEKISDTEKVNIANGITEPLKKRPAGRLVFEVVSHPRYVPLKGISTFRSPAVMKWARALIGFLDDITHRLDFIDPEDRQLASRIMKKFSLSLYRELLISRNFPRPKYFGLGSRNEIRQWEDLTARVWSSLFDRSDPGMGSLQSMIASASFEFKPSGEGFILSD